MDLNLTRGIRSAYTRIHTHIIRTPLVYSPRLSELCGCNVHLKMENWQLTGSFKIRGAMNKILALEKDKSHEAIVTASTGNHAAAVAHALETVSLNGIIFLPKNVSSAKAEKLKYYKKVKLRFQGEDSVIAERKAKEYAQKKDFVYVSPYNDPEVIYGQGTIGLEISEQLNEVDAVFVPVGGGGLISGIAGFMKFNGIDVETVGCQPQNSAVMYKSILKGRILDLPSKPTISDGTAGGIETDSITFDFCKNLVDSWVLVSENEILNGLKLMLTEQNLLVEGSAGLALAALLKNKERYVNKTVVLILCGGKFDQEFVRKVLRN